jgi:hypothetical protein
LVVWGFLLYTIALVGLERSDFVPEVILACEVALVRQSSVEPVDYSFHL